MGYNCKTVNIKDISLNVQDFQDHDWQGLLEGCESKDCSEYSPLFLKKAQQIDGEQEQKEKELYLLLGHLTSMMLTPGSPYEPFKPVSVFGNRRSAIVDDFTEEQLNVLSEVLPATRDAEMRARISDILWIRKRNHKFAEQAITSYLESAIVLEKIDKFATFIVRIERALRLSLILQNKNCYQIVVEHIKLYLKNYKSKDSGFVPNRLMLLLIECRYSDVSEYSHLCETLALKAESEKNFTLAESYWETKAKWHRIEKNAEEEKEALMKVAETHVHRAELSSRNLDKAHHIEKAIVAFRHIGGQSARVEDLHRQLLECQSLAKSEFQIITTKIDPSRLAEKAIEAVKGKPFQDAIFTLTCMIKSPKVDKLREQVKDGVKNFPLQYLFPAVVLTKEGRVTARHPSILSAEGEEAEKALLELMHREARFHYYMDSLEIIEPVRRQINLEHYYTLQDLLAIVSNSPLVPEEREWLFAMGFKEGLEGNFVVAAHLLIPQFEHSIRHLLFQRGVITSSIDSAGIQQENDLNTSLYKPELVEIFGEDVIFHLRCLLIEKTGCNLRNRMAHGLMSYSDFFSLDVEYLWCLILQLCYAPITNYIQDTTESPNGEIDKV